MKSSSKILNPTASETWHKVSPLVETKQENDLIASLRERKPKEQLILSESERQLLSGILRRDPHFKDASEQTLRRCALNLLL
jgi:hypothetical protein